VSEDDSCGRAETGETKGEGGGIEKEGGKGKEQVTEKIPRN